MVSKPPNPEDAIYEAAESDKIPPKPNFWMLKVFLKKRKVNLGLYTSDVWLQKYEQACAHLQEIEDDAESVSQSQDKPGQSAGEKGPEWPKTIDTSSGKDDAEEIDSAYHSECSADQNYRPECVIALVPGVEEYLDNGSKAAIACSYSDDDNDNYMLKGICERLKLEQEADGKVTLSFCWRSGGPSEVRRFIVRPLGDPEVKTDIRLGMAPLEVRTESTSEKDADEDEDVDEDADEDGDEDEDGDDEVQDIGTDTLTKTGQTSNNFNDNNIVIGIALGVAALQRCNGDMSKLGRDLRIAADSANGKTTQAAKGKKLGRKKKGS